MSHDDLMHKLMQDVSLILYFTLFDLHLIDSQLMNINSNLHINWYATKLAEFQL